MDKLEKFVTEHRNEFDIYEPDPELWNKIHRPNSRGNYLISWFWKAAVILLVFGASYLAHIHIKNTRHIVMKGDNMNPASATPELAETEKYYSGLIQTKLTEVQKVLASYPELKKDLRNDLAELDSIYRDLRKDLKENVSNQEVIEAMIQNYRLKLKLLEQIQQELQNQSDNNHKRHDHEL
jgi:hypothetical protein